MGNIIVTIIRLAVRAISPELRNLLVGSLASLKSQAEATASPWDDILVQILISLLGTEDTPDLPS